jgi:hypothetical protein
MLGFTTSLTLAATDDVDELDYEGALLLTATIVNPSGDTFWSMLGYGSMYASLTDNFDNTATITYTKETLRSETLKVRATNNGVYAEYIITLNEPTADEEAEEAA